MQQLRGYHRSSVRSLDMHDEAITISSNWIARRCAAAPAAGAKGAAPAAGAKAAAPAAGAKGAAPAAGAKAAPAAKKK